MSAPVNPSGTSPVIPTPYSSALDTTMMPISPQPSRTGTNETVLSTVARLSSPTPMPSPEVNEFDAQLAIDKDYDLQDNVGHPNNPPKSGKWSFVAGTNFDTANLNKPDAGKFIFYRVQENVEGVFDIRQYPKWQNFDWSDPQSLEKLNKWRTQVRGRTTGRVQEPALPWTLKEKETVKKHVIALLSQHSNRQTLFQAVTEAVKRELQDVTQPKNSELISTSVLKNGVQLFKKMNPGLSTADRTGFNRSWKTVYNKANEFADIRALLDKSGVKESSEGEDEASEASSGKKRKRTSTKDKAKAKKPKNATKKSKLEKTAADNRDMNDAQQLELTKRDNIVEENGDTTEDEVGEPVKK